MSAGGQAEVVRRIDVVKYHGQRPPRPQRPGEAGPPPTTEPQVPRVKSVRAAEWKDAKLVFELDLALLRDLLPPKYRGVWTASEFDLAIPGRPPIPVGFLPDLEMTYQVFFRKDPITALEDKPVSQDLMQLVRLEYKGGAYQPVSKAPGVEATPQIIQGEAGEIKMRIEITMPPTDPAARPLSDQVLGLLKLAPGDKTVLRRLIAVQG
jgi:hypothetical protein